MDFEAGVGSDEIRRRLIIRLKISTRLTSAKMAAADEGEAVLASGAVAPALRSAPSVLDEDGLRMRAGCICLSADGSQVRSMV